MNRGCRSNIKRWGLSVSVTIRFLIALLGVTVGMADRLPTVTDDRGDAINAVRCRARCLSLLQVFRLRQALY